ncbi:hypothetical protein GTP46_01150 [Duganella sp. FT135W]|uniref:DUF1640 domain-containing protein n=1 Tax=Duganella flavida TaxID=2692175 RepID=A0A6L8K2W8_9BURK|nr:hypothetical protein [Duganella flavida]MYM21255.1 hypothetical protein [Duganella flavida]
MEPQIVERVSTLETNVAVIQSTYVRKDELATLREEMGVGFAKTDIGFAKTNAKIDLVSTELNGKIDLLRKELDAKLERAIATMLRWTFGAQISIVALAIAALKYL